MKAEKSPAAIDPHAELNEAAAKLLAKLPARVREMLQETAVVTLKLPLWQLICGLIQGSYDMGLFTTPVIDQSWVSDMPVNPSTYQTTKCKYKGCGQWFQPRWPKQEFCSDLCGSHYQRDRLGREPRRHVVGGEHPLGQEPPGAVSSAVQLRERDSAG